MDTFRSQFQRRALIRRHPRTMRVNFFCTEGNGFRGQIKPVKAGGQLNHRRIAPRPHIGNDCGDGFVHIRRIFALHGQKCCKHRVKTGIADVEKLGH